MGDSLYVLAKDDGNLDALFRFRGGKIVGRIRLPDQVDPIALASVGDSLYVPARNAQGEKILLRFQEKTPSESQPKEEIRVLVV